MSEISTPDAPKITPTSQDQNRTLRQRYANVRPFIKNAVEKAFARGKSRKDISALREGAFHAAEQLQEEATIDTLTGLPRRKPFRETVEKEMESVQRNPEQKRLGLALMDLDDFGRYNKTYGDLAGDAALKTASKTIMDSVRKTDLPARWGGEELAIVMPRARTEESSTIEGVERVRQNIAAADIPVLHGQKIEHITASIGTTDYASGETFEDFFERSSVAVRLAKLFGKNRTVEAAKQADGTLFITDFKNGNTYMYDAGVENADGKNEFREYLTDLTEQVRFRIARDHENKKYLRIHEVLDPEHNTTA